jgi:hypothetical protein
MGRKPGGWGATRFQPILPIAGPNLRVDFRCPAKFITCSALRYNGFLAAGQVRAGMFLRESRESEE